MEGKWNGGEMRVMEICMRRSVITTTPDNEPLRVVQVAKYLKLFSFKYPQSTTSEQKQSSNQIIPYLLFLLPFPRCRYGSGLCP
jgi:hypothetical protein